MNIKAKPTFLLNIFHILIDGLFESVPLLLSFMAIAWGSGEKEVGLILSLAVMASTLTGLATKPLSRRFGRLTALTGITALYGAGFLLNAFSTNLYFAGGCFILATAGHTVFHSISFSYLSSATNRTGLGTALGNFTVPAWFRKTTATPAKNPRRRSQRKICRISPCCENPGMPYRSSQIASTRSAAIGSSLFCRFCCWRKASSPNKSACLPCSSRSAAWAGK